MIKINLLAEGKRPTAVRKSKSAELLKGQDVGMWLVGVGFLLGALVVGYFYWKATEAKQAQDEEIAAAQAEVAALDSVIKEVETFKAKKAALEQKIGVINDLKANQRGPVRVMDRISRALPELLWLDRMTMDDATITIEGRAFNTNAVANFIDNLYPDNPEKVEKSDELTLKFEEPTLKETSEQTGGIYKFSIEFKYSFTKPAPDAGTAGGGTEGGGTGGTAPSAAAPPPGTAPAAG